MPSNPFWRRSSSANRVFPDYLRHHAGLRAIPVLLVVLVIGYWLVRTLRRRRAVAQTA